MLALRISFFPLTWKLDWNHRDSNEVADLVAKFSLHFNCCILADEFPIINLPSDILDKLVCEQFVSY